MQRNLEQLQRSLFPRVIVRFENHQPQYLEFADGGWRETPAYDGPLGLFGQCVLLVPERNTLFRVRRFPQSSVKQAELAEAVELDLDLWSPWQEDRDFYFWPVRSGEDWSIAIWVWQTSALEVLTDATDIIPTHVMPERAWKIAALDAERFPAIYVDQIEAGKWSYAVLSASRAPQQITEVVDEVSLRRFKYSLDEQACDYPSLVDEGVDRALWLEGEQENYHPVSQKLPVAAALHYARQPGVKDWSDPFSWFKPLAAVMALYIVWLLGNSLVLWKQNRFVAEQVVEARAAAVEVLDQRAEVEKIHNRLEHMHQVRAEQMNLERALAALSLKLPRGAWLEWLEFNYSDGGWIDISGKAQQSIGLAALLEQMPEVQHAMFLQDIRKDKRTGLEPFRIRLKLAVDES